MFENILITGGSGSFGSRLLESVFDILPNTKRLVIFSRDEFKQYELYNKIKDFEFASKIRFFIGDIRDKERLKQAFSGIDLVIHAAALKQILTAEYNPMEAIKTNVLGAQNVIDMALEEGVGKVVALSTDKASSPTNLYGATKLCADKLFVAANYFKGNKITKYSVVRYGNVFGSRGSVVPLFLDKQKDGILPITDKKMTRFNISLSESVKYVLDCCVQSKGGEIFIPKMKSYKILDLAKAISKDCKINMIGIRPGEKVHEELISSHEASITFENKDSYIIVPEYLPTYEYYKKLYNKVPIDFFYDSGQNKEFLDLESLKTLLKDYKENVSEN